MRLKSLLWLTSKPTKAIAPLPRPLLRQVFCRTGSCTTPPQKQQSSQQINQKASATPSDQFRGSHETFRNTDASNENYADHRALGTELGLFTGHASSPGSPLFLPDGAHVFQKLQAFLRAQYPFFGFQEVITPNVYKDSLWRQSGHWDNYKDAMFSVHGGTATSDGEESSYSLKPMNCPGHCLLFKSQKRSWRELPVRYADFSPLHRNEASGSLSGLTRVRRFHQDDGHIFCTPDQVGEEIVSTLKFIDMVYKTLRVGPYRLVLSTRPEQDYIGSIGAWTKAENQLRDALNESGQDWKLNAGDGAFYGPKIDIILSDKNGKDHQTATIQLDFQLPQRFELEYQAPRRDGGAETPVMIHRAILGSLERFLALLIEQYQGRWPFWLSPRQVIILTVGESPQVLDYAKTVAGKLAVPNAKWHPETNPKPFPLLEPRYTVDTDFRRETLAKKTRDAKTKKYNVICFIGEKNVREQDLDIDFSGQPNQAETLDILNTIKSGTRSPVQGIVASKMRPLPGVKLDQLRTSKALEILCENYL